MSAFLVAWALCMVAACFVVTFVSVASEVRNHRRTVAGRTPAPAPVSVVVPAPVSAAVVVEVLDSQTFEEFLAELIITPHVEQALS